DKISAEQRVAALGSPNGWTRDMAQQLIVAQDKFELKQSLLQMLGESANPVARLHALATLAGRGELTPIDLVHAMADQYPGIRRHGIRASESYLPQRWEDLATSYQRLLKDPDPQV